MNTLDSKINPLCFKDYSTFWFTKRHVQEEKKEQELNDIIKEIEQRQKERDNKPYVFQK